ncbi:Mus81p PWA37_001490 [Arxiozyma heterogenica]|uniref:Mus81p n=1 Tax=Arxiozyma heterogenica TaxID=278026 RepID=UPI002F0D4C91
MSLPNNLKSFYVQWLDEFIERLTPRQEQLNLTYNKAKRNLEDTDDIFYYPQDLKKVKGIGTTIVNRLEKRLEEYCKEINVPVPDKSELVGSPRKRKVTALRINTVDQNDTVRELNENITQTKKRKVKEYIPKKRSGGYGIMLGLLELKAYRRSVTKEDIIQVGQKYISVSMIPNHSTKEFYGAWSSISSLKKHELVLEEGKPRRYTLTEKGVQLAKTLKLADNLVFDTDDETENPINGDFEDTEVSADLSMLLKSNKVETAEKRDSSFIETTFQNINLSKNPNTGDNDTLNNTSFDAATDSGLSESQRIVRRRFEGISYEIWKSNTFEIYPIIDYREIKSQNDREFFSNAFARKNMKHEIRQLSLGDIVWVAKNKTTGTLCILNTIIERKRLDDLAMSIRDNRFIEQKNRLENSGCNYKYYLIEEIMSSSISNMSEALKTALWSILIYYRFSIIRTSSSEQTVDKLHALHTVLRREYSKKDLLVLFPKSLENQQDYRTSLQRFKLEFSQGTNIECCHTFETFQDIMGKRDMRTVGELTIQILMYVKGVSLEKAVAIQALYPTLNHLLCAYRSCKSNLEAKQLLYMKLGNAPGNKRITKVLSAKIADVFTAD